MSTSDQDLTLQIDALKKHGCGKHHIFVDKASGARSKRPGLAACLEELQRGDVLLVLRLDRLGRSLNTLPLDGLPTAASIHSDPGLACKIAAFCPLPWKERTNHD